jgi:hypothetical protein
MAVASELNYLLVERALSGSHPIAHLSPDEKDFVQKYKPVFDVCRLAHRLAQGYVAHCAAMEIAKGPDAKALASGTPLRPIPNYADYITRKDGTQHTFDLPHYLDQAHNNPEIVEELPRVWLKGALLTVGDALNALQPAYLNKAPILEMLYHLRNGVAHGNVFHFEAAGLKRLRKHPAHNRKASVKSGASSVFEIVPELQGKPVLFDFMGPGDVLDLLLSVEVYLTRVRERHSAGELTGLLG